MEYLIEMIYSLADLGFTPLNVVLIVMLYVFMASHGIVPRFWKRRDTEEEEKKKEEEKVPQWAENLIGHFNDTTTDHLENIEKTTKSIDGKVDKIHDKHEEWEKYGVPLKTDK